MSELGPSPLAAGEHNLSVAEARAAIAGGIILFLTAPSAIEHTDRTALYLAPTIGEGGGGVVLGGSY